MEERDFHDEARDVLRALLLELARDTREAEPRLGCRVADNPVDRREDVALHLDERALVVRAAAHLAELRHSRDAVLRVLKLGRDPERGAPDELVVLLEHDPLRDVAVHNVEREVECFRTQAKLLVDLDEKVDEVRAHVPLQLGLLVDEVHRGRRLALHERVMRVSGMPFEFPLPPHGPSPQDASPRSQTRRGRGAHLHVEHVRLDIVLVLELEQALHVRHLRRRLPQDLGRDELRRRPTERVAHGRRLALRERRGW